MGASHPSNHSTELRNAAAGVRRAGFRKCLLGLVSFQSNFTEGLVRDRAHLYARSNDDRDDRPPSVSQRHRATGRATAGLHLRGLGAAAQTARPECEEDFANPFGHLSTISTLFGESWGLLLGLAQARLPLTL
jgi:hypothetical protein